MIKSNITIALVKQYLEYKESREGAKERAETAKRNGNNLTYRVNVSEEIKLNERMSTVRQSAILLDISNNMWDKELTKQLKG